jgi:hypothetical protein
MGRHRLDRSAAYCHFRQGSNSGKTFGKVEKTRIPKRCDKNALPSIHPMDIGHPLLATVLRSNFTTFKTLYVIESTFIR